MPLEAPRAIHSALLCVKAEEGYTVDLRIKNPYFTYRLADQRFEAGNVKFCYELHPRMCFRFIIRLQEGVLIMFVYESSRLG